MGFSIATGIAIWAAVTYAPAGTDRVTAVIVSAAAALGLSWKGLGATLGKALGQAETALWASEVSVSVEKAASLLPHGKPENARIIIRAYRRFTGNKTTGGTNA